MIVEVKVKEYMLNFYFLLGIEFCDIFMVLNNKIK